MVVRLRLGSGPRVTRKSGPGRRIALALAALLTPAAFTAAVLAFWRLSADMGWTSEFAIRDGLFSHWQVWMAISAALQLSAVGLTKAAKRPQPSTPA